MSCGRDEKSKGRKCPLESVSDTDAVRTLNSTNDVRRFVNKQNDLLRKHVYLIHFAYALYLLKSHPPFRCFVETHAFVWN